MKVFSKISKSYLVILKAIFLIASFVCVESVNVNAQIIAQDSSRFIYEQDRYHFKKGWIHSIGISVDPVAPFHLVEKVLVGPGPKISVQHDYRGYFLVNPKLGLGVSFSYTQYPTSELSNGYYKHYNFMEYAGYAKFYFTNGRRRPYVDAKLGYSQASDGKIKFRCKDCGQEGDLYLRYTSGPAIQGGVGIDFATASFVKCGVKLSFSATTVTRQKDRYHDAWETTPDGIVKRSTNDTPLGTLFIGFNIYI